MKATNKILEACKALKNVIDWEYGVAYSTKELFGTKQGLYEMKLASDWYMVPVSVKNQVLLALK